MNPFSAFVVYILLWWLTLFIILPQGIKAQSEDGEIVKGSEPGAPVDANIKAKFIRTTIIATVLWVLTCALIMSGLVQWDMFGNWFDR